MKIKRHPPLFPPYPNVDEFGFPLLGLLQKFDEPEEKKKERIKKVQRFAFKVFEAVKEQLEEDEARKLFVSLAQNPKEAKIGRAEKESLSIPDETRSF